MFEPAKRRRYAFAASPLGGRGLRHPEAPLVRFLDCPLPHQGKRTCASLERSGLGLAPGSLAALRVGRLGGGSPARGAFWAS